MRTKKTLYNISTSMIAQIVAVACGLITPRLILSTFGSTYNGVINSATQFLSFVSILRLGIAGATRVALYKTLANNDSDGTSRIMKATKLYMRKIAVVIVVYAGILMLVYPFISNNDLSRLDCAMIIGIVSISTFAEYFFGLSNATLLSADQSEYISNVLNMVMLIINTILTAVLIRLRLSIFAVKLGSSIVFLISPFILNCYVKSKYKLTNNCQPDNSAINQRHAVAFHSIANIIHGSTDIILLTLFTDAKVISVYTVYNMVLGKLKSFLQVFTGGMEAAFGNIWVKGEKEILRNSFQGFEFLIYSFTSIVFSCTGILILSFVALYTKGVTDVEYVRSDLAILITVTEAIYCIRQPYLLLVQAAGHYEETKKGAMVEALVNLVSSVILVNVMGICGVIIGTLLANTIRTSQYIWYSSKNLLNRPILDVVKRIIVLFLNITSIAIVSILVQKHIVAPETWLAWLLNGAIVFFVACIITCLTGLLFYRSDFFYLFNKLKAVTKR